ncbi:Uncharacterised protein [Shigella sonnei]|nr:Uncharacterised protein [Shigella sonnei]
MQVLRVSRVRSSLYCRVSASATLGAKPSAAAVVPAIPPAQILKNCLLLTCMDCSLFRHCHVPFTFACCVCREWELFFFAEGAAKVQNWLNFPPSRKGL